MVHFQWTGSDYNPRRGCNNGEGGPPDANTFFTDANAKLNPRADRSNLLFMDNMASNTPRDYTGYEETATMTYAQKTSTSKATILSHLPCYDPVTDTDTGTDTGGTDTGTGTDTDTDCAIGCVCGMALGLDLDLSCLGPAGPGPSSIELREEFAQQAMKGDDCS